MTKKTKHPRIAIEAIARHAVPFSPLGNQYRPLLERARDADVVLIGAATSGTMEFQRVRAELTQHLLRDCGFSALAIDADWPNTYRLNRFVHGSSEDADALTSLSEFQRFPAWIWRNQGFVDFLNWLRERNLGLPVDDRAGVFGLDLCSLERSRARVLAYLDGVDAEAAARARERYSCFDFVGHEAKEYGYAVAFGIAKDCESEVVQQLIEMRSQSAERIARGGHLLCDSEFSALQDARTVLNAERYYRQMFSDTLGAWNAREFHMFHTLQELRTHLARRSESPKIVVWAHNSHVGDVNALVRADEDERSLGELVRQAYPGRSVLVGMTTYEGTVTAADSWEGTVEPKRLLPAVADSIESRFHATGLAKFVLEVRGAPEALALDSDLLERSVGPVYRPDIERSKHYQHVRVGRQFDFLIHLDVTRAVPPLGGMSTIDSRTSPTGTD